MEERGISSTGGISANFMGGGWIYGKGTMTGPARLLRHGLLPDHASKTSRFLEGRLGPIVGR